ncbi:MAG: hypothetical protein IJ229_01895 [Clostridia bacterium]|nr:hypothetical protein [Clostridia bacterium]
MRQARLSWLLLCCLVLLTSCRVPTPPDTVQIVFEDNPQIRMEKQVFRPLRGEDLSVDVLVPSGQEIASVSYERYSLSAKLGEVNGFDKYTLTLHALRYPARIRLTLADRCIFHIVLEDGKTEDIPDAGGHLRPNSPAWDPAYAPEGTVQIAWETEDGTLVTPGSRTDRTGSVISLRPCCLPFTDSVCFSYETYADHAVITKVLSGDVQIVIPETLEELPVKGIAPGALQGLTLDTLVLPTSLTSVAEGAFQDCTIDTLCFFDTLTGISDAAFPGTQVHTLRLIAASAPVWSGTYFDTLPDKLDRLMTTPAPHLLLFCGSSARFGWNSPMLDLAFPEYSVVNLGVYAYANMLPYARMVTSLAESGDLLLSSPEMDAIDCQFCFMQTFAPEWFAMTESNWDLLGLLDLTEFTGVFDSFSAFQKQKQRMEKHSYAEVPSMFDEDGAPTLTPSYNAYGDYVLYRENNLSGRLFGVKRAYYEPDMLTESVLSGLNAVYDALIDKGVSVYFTWSPRSAQSISEGSAGENIRLTEEKLRAHLHVPMLSSVTDSLLPALYFYGTDNHLSTEGSALYTQDLIEQLRAAREEALP